MSRSSQVYGAVFVLACGLLSLVLYTPYFPDAQIADMMAITLMSLLLFTISIASDRGQKD